MRFNFDLPETSTKHNDNNKKEQTNNNLLLSSPYRSPSSSTPNNDLQWVPLQNHPLFSAEFSFSGDSSSSRRFPRNLLAFDGDSRLYFWDSHEACLHRISLRLGEPEPTSVLAASPSKVLRADMVLDFAINLILINRNGSALLLGSPDNIHVMYLYGRTSPKDNYVICRTVRVGNVFQNSDSAIRILQLMWHPYSDTHLAVLSSDSVFRIFDLSSDLDQPEQAYYIQPVDLGRSRNASSICPVDFSFGRDHLWDRFSVFVMFSDGSVYILCPVVPFGSVYMWESILEIYSDAQTFGLRSVNPTAVSNSSMAISWLEATFSELNQDRLGSPPSAVKARPFVLVDASLSLQGPLCKACHGEEDDPGFRASECGGRAVSFLYNSIDKDSILMIAWSGGQLQIDALADEIQPLWTSGNLPRISFDPQNRILGFAMICESAVGQCSVVRLDKPLDYSDWSGHPPPLLRLAIVDLDLPKKKDGDSIISMYIDPLIPERIYCLHDGGVDSIVLHFLPFTHQTSGKDEMMKTPSVHSVVSTLSSSDAPSSSLYGFVVLSDSYGYSWIAGVTSTRQCIILEMESWNMLLPRLMDTEKRPTEMEEAGERTTLDIISRELLVGPKVVAVPQGSNLRSVAADSIEGRSSLHEYFKLFHENYGEYAHKVYFELKHHGPHLKKMIDNLHTRLSEAQQKLVNVEKKQPQLDDRIKCSIQRHESLEERLHKLRRLPGINKKPFTKAEREFKEELDRYTGVELDALHSSIEALSGRLRRATQSVKEKVPNYQRTPSSKKCLAQNSQLDELKASLEKLSLVNSENTKKLKLVESALKNWEEETAK